MTEILCYRPVFCFKLHAKVRISGLRKCNPGHFIPTIIPTFVYPFFVDGIAFKNIKTSSIL